jgi:Divergent CRAL/TRIO domain
MADASYVLYVKHLALARCSDLSDAERADVFRAWPGRDRENRPVLVFVPAHLRKAELEQAFLLFIRDADAIAHSPYRIVLVNSNNAVGLRLAIWAARRARSILPRRYRKNLEAVSVVHPSIFLRAVVYALSPFVSSKFWSKVQFADRIEELDLDGTFNRPDLMSLLPDSCRDYDDLLNIEAAQYRAQAVGLGYRVPEILTPSTSNEPQ